MGSYQAIIMNAQKETTYIHARACIPKNIRV